MAARRAAFDIGSGATKLMVADVANSCVQKVYFQGEVPVAFAIDWKQSADNTLSETIQAKGISVLKDFLGLCVQHGVPDAGRAAIATEVFRKASNGGAYLERVRKECGLDVEVVSQAIEAELGFQTAVALNGSPPERTVCWDSGGASFQITSLPESSASDQGLRSYVGTFGSGNTTALLVESVLGRNFASNPSPNPVSAEQAKALVSLLQSQLASPPAWLAGTEVVAIGGINCMFKVTSEVLGRTRYTLADVRSALQSIVGLSDEDLAQMACCKGELREPPGLIVPKVCLLLAVMEHCGMAEVSFCPAVGSCPGVLIDDKRYMTS
mmetsp:Transcript_44355/g.105017  ORF Transcript_44355/g.105017 Transcript_44355/m.105017 type:complete len:325 (+) Transcript_44355:122-1096(+)